MRAILTYHSIDESGSPISVSPDAFRAHHRWLTGGSMKTALLADLISGPDDGQHAVAITFDDGVANIRKPIELLLDAAGPKLQSELDVAWVARSGNDPAEFLGTLNGRVFAIHAKDNAPAGTAENERGFATIGTGVLDWKTILPAAKHAGAQWFILEHDLPLDAEAVEIVA